VPPPDELELLDDDELLELDELLDEELEPDDDELLELELLLDDEELPPPLQAGNWKLPLCVPWKPKLVLCPADKLPFHETFVAVTVLPDVTRFALQEPVIPGL
jgi:hypothetical protein